MPLTQPLRCRLRPSLHLLGHSYPLCLSAQQRILATLSPHKSRLSSLYNARPASHPPVKSISMTQTRGHGGHSHGHHHHHHDNVYLTSSNKKDAGVRITRIGLVANLAMAISKFIGGYVFHSQALIADAYHALADLVSDFLTLGTVAWSLKPPSERFPNGYGKVESVGALGVSGLLLFGGVFMGLNAGQLLLAQFYPEAAEMLAHSGLLGHGHSHSHGVDVHGPNIHAAWLAGGSIIVKEWLYHATMKVAEERKSSVLASNAMHHRIDSLTSIVALATIGGSYVFQDATWLDPVGGLAISLMVVRAGWGNTVTSLYELADTSVDDEIKASVQTAASKALKDIEGGQHVIVRDVQGMKSGQNYLMDVELALPGDWAIKRSRGVEEAVRHSIGAGVRGVKRVKVRFVPVEEKELTFAEEFINPEESANLETHEHAHDHEHDHDDHGKASESHSHGGSTSLKKR
ncbi:hypothetical protein N7468_003340 [Penicillium chermesinum]|uniref:Cation efflux protein transmembrane domain-containing protein n=1 Tax=Penicillium chermesinum TaxID=63820 RepID=A0A9W9P6Y0_9EURO|nr:uncharacterized protein N7468_003340 [Penicillium chermesinum]KAJ5238721.1 hypothetical protein N7468_003340 [Penicillium chermesinum]KAJ6164366.1 hypothetical protein N7470_003038 [Penicillium chermesinum]